MMVLFSQVASKISVYTYCVPERQALTNVVSTHKFCSGRRIIYLDKSKCHNFKLPLASNVSSFDLIV